MGRQGGIQLYVEKILALERTIDRGVKELSRLYSVLEKGLPGSDPKIVKARLDVIDGLLRAAKIQADFYIKLGQSYDLVKFHSDLLSVLRRRDLNLALEVVHEVEELWIEELNRLRG